MPYIGVNTIVPGEQKFYNAENFDLFFDTTVGYHSDGAELPVISETVDSETVIESPIGVKTSFVMIYTAKLDINNFSIDYTYNVSNSNNQAVLAVKGETILSVKTGSSNGSWEGNLLEGDTIQMTYIINTAASNTGFSLITNTSTTISTEGYTAEVARKVRNMYVGVETDVAIKETTTTTNIYNFSYANFPYFFSVETASGTTGWTYLPHAENNVEAGIILQPNNFGDTGNNTTATITFTALKDLTNVTIKGCYYTETNYDKITLTVAGTEELSQVSGKQSDEAEFYSGNLSSGQTIMLTYKKDSSNSGYNRENEENTFFTIDCDDITITTTTEEIVGFEKKEVARKIISGYVGIEGVARRFFSSEIMSYTGDYTITDVAINTAPYKLYTLTSSGTLIINDSIEYWMCSGGKAGGNAYTSATLQSAGRGGAGGAVISGILTAGTHAVTIGAANSGNTSIGSIVATNSTGSLQDGETGGGGAGYIQNSAVTVRSGGTGSGESTIPFNGKITTGFNNYKHSAGGGGGTCGELVSLFETCAGGAGGSNGEDGEDAYSDAAAVDGGAGGSYGGGAGGGMNTNNGANATFYGAGGGGGTSFYLSSSEMMKGNGGDGYQGVVYLLIPA